MSTPSTTAHIVLFGATPCVDDAVSGCTGEVSDAITGGEVVIEDGVMGWGFTAVIKGHQPPTRGAAPTNASVVALVCDSTDPSSVTYLLERAWPALDGQYSRTPFLILLLEPPEGSAAATPTSAAVEAQLEPLGFGAVARYYGVVAAPRSHAQEAMLPFLQKCASITRNPAHVLWDRRTKSTTPTGQALLRRLFWTLDKDVDGYLGDKEVRAWHDAMFHETTDKDVASLLQFLQQQGQRAGSTVASGGGEGVPTLLHPHRGPTLAGFLLVCSSMLAQGQHDAVWDAVHASGVGPDGLPYRPAELDHIRCAPDSALQLSHNGTQFFKSVYSTRRFVSLEDVWTFVPACPWEGVHGLPQPSRDMLDAATFLHCWRYMTLVAPRAVAEFAFWWGYRSDPNLLFVQKKRREFRQQEADFPSVYDVLVVGAPRSGKSALIRRLTDASGTLLGGIGGSTASSELADGAAATLTALAPYSSDGNRDGLVVYSEINDELASQVLRDRQRMATADLVLLVVDASDPYSFSFVANLFDARLRALERLPCIFVMTKIDLDIVEPRSSESPEAFSRLRGLLWPPVLTSATEPSGPLVATNIGLINAVEDVTALVADTVRFPDAGTADKLTPARIARRVFLVTVAAAAVVAATTVTYRAIRRLLGQSSSGRQ